ncbi:MAG: signal peptidase II [Gemmatimonadota bacterium]
MPNGDADAWTGAPAGPASREASAAGGGAAESAGRDLTRDRSGFRKSKLAFTVIGLIVVLDILTKLWVVRTLTLHQPVPILGEFFRLTYTYNPGAAFGINVGEHSRAFFLVLSVVALLVLGTIYRHTSASDRVRLLALSMVAGGALGNILDRIRYPQGVVDWLDVGLGSLRWPVFNVADMAVSTGAVLLLVSFYLEERHERREGEPDG